MENIILNILSLSIVSILVLSFIVGFVLGLKESIVIAMFKDSSKIKKNYHCRFERGTIRQSILSILSFMFYSRIVTTIMALLTYKFKAWSRKVVYNFLFNNSYIFSEIKDLKLIRFKLISDKYPNGFWGLERTEGTTGKLSKEYLKAKYAIFKIEEFYYIKILFPIAFAIWLYHNDKNEYDMAGEKIDNRIIYNRSNLTFIPKFITNYCNPDIICKHNGSYLAVGDKQIKEIAIISFILNRLFVDEFEGLNFHSYFDYKI